MLLEISRTDVIWQISFITLFMLLLSQWFQKKFSLSQESQMSMQADITDLQERMKSAKGDTQQMQQLNAELMVVMKNMSKKQMIPMLLRSFLFFGLFGILRWVYGDYKEGLLPFKVLLGDGYLGLYFTLSLSLSLVIMLIKMAIKKLNPEKDKKKENFIDQAKVLRSNIIYAREEPNEENNNYHTSTSTSTSTKKWKQQLKNGS